MPEQTPVDAPSSYMDFLPANTRVGESNGKANLLGRFLKIFEKLLSGIDDEVRLEVQSAEGKPQRRAVIGIEDVLDTIHDYFDPLFTPSAAVNSQEVSNFLTYLAQWVALSFDEKWELHARRRLLTRIVPLYKKRGTKSGLSEYLSVFVGPNISVDDFINGIVVGKTGTIGLDTFVGGLPPYLFIVTITFLDITSIGFVNQTIVATKSILDLEKPAHTYYALRFAFPGIIVGERSTIAKDTVIGTNYPVFV
jgi:phage tail-like protein